MLNSFQRLSATFQLSTHCLEVLSVILQKQVDFYSVTKHRILMLSQLFVAQKCMQLTIFNYYFSRYTTFSSFLYMQAKIIFSRFQVIFGNYQWIFSNF